MLPGHISACFGSCMIWHGVVACCRKAVKKWVLTKHFIHICDNYISLNLLSARFSTINFGRAAFVGLIRPDPKTSIGEGHLFATLLDLRPPPLQINWWGIKAQNTCQNVGHIHSVRSDPLRFSHLSGGRHQAMENEKCNFLTWNGNYHN